MMAEATPGPWTFDPDTMDVRHGACQVLRVYAEHDFPCIEDEDREAAKAECLANGHLAGASRLLLEALEGLLDATVEADLSHGVVLSNEEREAREKAVSAIATARGVA